MEKRTLNVGLIGCGDISPSHLKTYKAVGLNLLAVCDARQDRAQKRKEEFGTEKTRVLADYRTLLAIPEIDIVTVATPVAMHAPLTIDAVKAGKHVVCEKPSALSIRENEQIAAAAKKARRHVVFCSARMRWGNSTIARQYIKDGDLGDIYHVSVQFYRSRGRPGVDIIPDARWFANKKLAGGGVLMDMGQYFMDNVLSLTDWPVITSVSATTFKGFPHNLPKDVVYNVEEHCTILARAKKGVTLTFDYANISHQKPMTRIAILGTKGGIINQDGAFRFYNEKGGPWQQMEHTTLWQDKTGGDTHIYINMCAAIHGEDVEPGTTPEQALAITKLTQMAYLSAERGREVSVNELPKS
jgi:predicted dehydrogenase